MFIFSYRFFLYGGGYLGGVVFEVYFEFGFVFMKGVCFGF